MRVALVAAVALNGVIGDRGRLIWRISDDLKWFKKQTMGKPIVMGRKTFDSIGRPLPGRRNIVVTRADSWAADGVVRAASIDEALSAAGSGADEICVIGGGEIYAAALQRAARIYLTRVLTSPSGDARFPQIDARDWRKTAIGACEAGPKNEYSCEFFILDRVTRP